MANSERPASIALVDISYLFKKRWHTWDGQRNGAAEATIKDLVDLKNGVEHLIICRDSPPYTTRLDIFPGYKANRPSVEPEERAQRKVVFEEIERLGFNIAAAQGYEADDIIATLAANYGEWCKDVRIVSCDKDAAQCLTGNVAQYIPPVGAKDWVVRGPLDVEQKWGVTPALMPMFQALVGDATDNVPGVKGIGETGAAKLLQRWPTLELLAKGLAEEAQQPKPKAYVGHILRNWEQLVLSLKLVTLATNVPLDPEALLVKRAPAPEKEFVNDMQPANDAAPANDVEPVVVDATEQQQKENIAAASRAFARQPLAHKPARSSGIVLPDYHHPKYGIVTADLQPVDLTAAYQMSEWLVKSNLYQQYKTPAQVFAIMVRAKELGIGVSAALAGFHIMDGKPVASADLIRALAERDPTFEYLYPTEMSPTRCVWEGKKRGNPKPVPFPYSIEDAQQAGLVRSGNYGKGGNWVTRPQDMLNKTAASKLARILWPGATMGLYCPEEMGSSTEELEAREAA